MNEPNNENDRLEAFFDLIRNSTDDPSGEESLTFHQLALAFFARWDNDPRLSAFFDLLQGGTGDLSEEEALEFHDEALRQFIAAGYSEDNLPPVDSIFSVWFQAICEARAQYMEDLQRTLGDSTPKSVH